MAPAENRPLRLVFEPFGWGISCRGLTFRELEGAAGRWGCEVGEMGFAPGRPELTVHSRPGQATGGVRADSVAAEVSPVEKKFGPWTVFMAPGPGGDVIAPVSSAARKSPRFAEAFDLCVTHQLALRGAAVLHAAAMEIEGVGVLAVGGSGCGKSTVAAAALRAGGRVVSDDVLVAAESPGGGVWVAPLRGDMVLREAGRSILPQALHRRLQVVDDGKEARWRLPGASASTLFAAGTRPQHIWLLSVDRRLGKTFAGGVDQATALAWLIRGTAPLFLRPPFDAERQAVVDVFASLAEGASAIRVRLAEDLLEDPRGTIQGLLVAGGH